MMQHHHERPHVVYRAFDAEGTLLYVGCTWNIERRMECHRRHPMSKRWVPFVAEVRQQAYENRRQALAIESLLIRTMRPVFNTVGKREALPALDARRDAYLASRTEVAA